MKTIIIDGNYVLHKNFYVFKNFKYGELMTGTTFGFVKDVLKLYEKFNTNDIHVTWDSRSFRKDLNSDYKANRVRDPENNPYQNFDLVTDSLDAIGINQYKIPEMESDDLIYTLSKKFEDVIIYSRDKDLFQCIKQNVSIITDLDKDVIVGISNFEEMYGFPFSRDNFVLYKSVVGDGSDNVKGIPRFRKKDIVEFINTGKMKEKPLLVLNENLSLIEKNKKMFELVNLDKIDPMFNTKYDENKIKNIFDRTAIKFFNSEILKGLKK
jgi:5'-3' exonuclease